MFEIADFKLTDLLSSASATIGIIIGGTIFLQFLSSKYTELTARFRDLTKEYRNSKDEDARHGPLQFQIRVYRRRLWLLNRASGLAVLALIGFIGAVFAGGASMAYPAQLAFKVIGAGGLMTGLLCIGGGVGLEFVECVLARHEIGTEVADLDPDAKKRSL